MLVLNYCTKVIIYNYLKSKRNKMLIEEQWCVNLETILREINMTRGACKIYCHVGEHIY